MDSKPVVTCAGDEKLFSSLQKALIEGISEESVEWKRSHMRNPKSVYMTANFVPFTEERLPDEGIKSLLGQAFFHIYWTECYDIDHYKQAVKENISAWLTKLKAKKIYDWLIVVVDHSESKKTNKTKLLPRTTVLDKIKSDFPSQSSQRCISLLDPHRNDSRAVESWQSLLQRIRKLILQAYSRQLGQFEEHMRTQRERRNEHGWSFQKFFFLQEELAFVLEMLGLYEEALVQYDELDALFTQFVINSNVGDMPEWLSAYSRPCDLWSGVCLLRERYSQLRDVLLKGDASLLDLRNYLFSRQCALLLLLCRPWEVAQRTLPFLHNCISELRTLEVTMPPGSVACWVFLSCFEVLQTCEKFSDTSQIKEYSLYCAGLWAYAREKLHQLGILCGLMPDLDENSEKLHIVVGLLAGMGEDPYSETGTESPHAKLRGALSSKESFLKYYLELSELTMGTFKHNRRIRTARVIGRDLAQLYMKMKQPQKAISFLADLLKTYREENWEVLTASIQQDLFECYLAMNDTRRYLKTCIRLSATPIFTLDQRRDYFQEIIKCSEKLGSDPLLLRTEKTFLVNGTKIESAVIPIIRNSNITITFHILSNLPSEIICRNMKLILKKQNAPTSEKSKSTDSHLSLRSNVTSAHSPMSPIQSGELGIPSRDDMPQRITVQPQLIIGSYRQDSSQIYSVMCKNTHQVLRRRDSQGFHKDDISEEDSGPCFKSTMVKLIPGMNVVTIEVKTSESGLYLFHRLWMEWGNIHFALTSMNPLFSFVVSEELPAVNIKPESGDLLAGIEQNLILSICSGSSYFTDSTFLFLKSSRGLKLKVADTDSDWIEDVNIKIPVMDPFNSVEIPIKAIVQFGPQKNANTIEHFICLQCPWLTAPQRISLHFLPPFLLSQKLHSCGTRKYIQIVIHGMSPRQFFFSDAKLTSSDQKDAILKALNSNKDLIVDSDQTASFLWEIATEDIEPHELPLNFHFCSNYELRKTITLGPYQYNFDFKLNYYETLYAVRARVEPPKGSEFCRAGITCFMHISINQIHFSDFTSLMYEVVADQTMWAVCGRTAGVVNIDESGKHSVVLDVMPLISGFLPLPTVRLSKYIPADQRRPMAKEEICNNHKTFETFFGLSRSDSTPSKDSGNYNVARLEPFDSGQVYSWSRAMQVHVLPASGAASIDVSS